MAELSTTNLVKDMVNAAKGIITDKWKEVKPFAEQEFRNLALNFKLIHRLKKQEKITKEQAVHYIAIQKNSLRVVLLTIEGLGLLAVEQAINAAIDAVRDAVNTVIGWKIL